MVSMLSTINCHNIVIKIIALDYFKLLYSNDNVFFFIFTAFFWGDPHITTIDGRKYTFNGLGEYWMIKSLNLTVQARTVQAVNMDGQMANATVFGAFAMKKEGSDIISVTMNATTTGIKYDIA